MAMPIFVIETLTGKTITIDCEPSTTIAEIKVKLQEKVDGVHPRYHALVFAGKALQNDRTLESYNIQKESNLYLTITKDADVTELTVRRMVELTKKRMEIEKYQQSELALQSEVNALKAENTKKEEQLSILQASSENAQHKVEALQRELNALKTSTEEESKAHGDRVSALEQQVEHQNRSLNEKETAHQDQLAEMKALHDAETHTLQSTKNAKIDALQREMDGILNTTDKQHAVLQYDLQTNRKRIAAMNQKLSDIQKCSVAELTDICEKMEEFKQELDPHKHENQQLPICMKNLDTFKILINNAALSIANMIADDEHQSELQSVPTIEILAEINEMEEKSTNNIKQNQIANKNHQLVQLQEMVGKLKRVKAKRESNFANVSEWSSTYLCDRYPIVAQSILVYTSLIHALDSYLAHEECDEVFLISRWCMLGVMLVYITWIGYKTSQYRSSWTLFLATFWFQYFVFALIITLQLSLPPLPCYTGNVSYIPMTALIIIVLIVVSMSLAASPTVRYHVYERCSRNVWYSKPIQTADANLEGVGMNEFPDIVTNDYIDQIEYKYVADVGLKIVSVKLAGMTETIIGKREQTEEIAQYAVKQTERIQKGLDVVGEVKEKVDEYKGKDHTKEEEEKEEVAADDAENDEEEEAKEVVDEDENNEEETEEVGEKNKRITFQKGEYCTKAIVYCKKNLLNEQVSQIMAMELITNQNAKGYVMGMLGKVGDREHDDLCVAEAKLIKPSQSAGDSEFALSRILCYDHNGCITGVQMAFTRLDANRAKGDQTAAQLTVAIDGNNEAMQKYQE